MQAEVTEENVLVVVRIRPLQDTERSRNEKPCVKAITNGKEVQVMTGELDAHTYRCNACFPLLVGFVVSNSSRDRIYNYR